MVILLRWLVEWRENGHVMVVDSNRESRLLERWSS